VVVDEGEESTVSNGTEFHKLGEKVQHEADNQQRGKNFFWEIFNLTKFLSLSGTKSNAHLVRTE
jgi:hypothetical protein